MKTIQIIDLFSGTGGFSKGITKSRKTKSEVILGIDLLPVSCETFRLNHRNASIIADDIRHVRRRDIQQQLNISKGDVDLIVGGPPCQGFSSIRPFRSSNDDDPRNNLFEEFASFVNYFRPKAFILENVVGLATHKNGSTLAQLDECFAALSYETDWRILNAAHYGVPQKRERLIYIGMQKGGRISFPIPTHFSNGSTIGFKDRGRMLTVREPDLFDQPKPLPRAITVEEAIGDLPGLRSGEEIVIYSNEPKNIYQRARRGNTRHLTWHSSTNHSPKMLEIIRHSGKNISCIPPHLITSGFSSCYSRLDAEEPAVTITVNFVHPASNRCIHPSQNRALTPREGARLQSFDDSYRFAGNRSQVAKQIGNAVPPILGKVLADELLPQLT